MGAGDNAARVVQLKRAVGVAVVADAAGETFLRGDGQNGCGIETSSASALDNRLDDWVRQVYTAPMLEWANWFLLTLGVLLVAAVLLDPLLNRRRRDD